MERDSDALNADASTLQSKKPGRYSATEYTSKYGFDSADIVENSSEPRRLQTKR